MQDKVCSPQTKNKDSEGMFGFRALREQSNYHMINQTSSNNFGVWNHHHVEFLEGCKSDANI